MSRLTSTLSWCTQQSWVRILALVRFKKLTKWKGEKQIFCIPLDGNSAECPAAQLRFSINTSKGSSGGCVHALLEQADLSLSVLVSQMRGHTHVQDNALQKTRGHSRPLLPYKSAVSQTRGTFRQNPTLRHRYLITSTRQYKMEKAQDLWQMHCLQFLRRCLSRRVEPSEIDIILAANRHSAIRWIDIALRYPQNLCPSKETSSEISQSLASLKPHTIRRVLYLWNFY